MHVGPMTLLTLTFTKPALARGTKMATFTYDREITALIVIDPYNDFISEGGKIWDRIQECGGGK